MSLGRGMSGFPSWTCCLCDMTSDKQKIMDGWIDALSNVDKDMLRENVSMFMELINDVMPIVTIKLTVWLPRWLAQ